MAIFDALIDQMLRQHIYAAPAIGADEISHKSALATLRSTSAMGSDLLSSQT